LQPFLQLCSQLFEAVVHVPANLFFDRFKVLV
jgi:hypothetical protein